MASVMNPRTCDTQISNIPKDLDEQQPKQVERIAFLPTTATSMHASTKGVLPGSEKRKLGNDGGETEASTLLRKRTKNEKAVLSLANKAFTAFETDRGQKRRFSATENSDREDTLPPNKCLKKSPKTKTPNRYHQRLNKTSDSCNRAGRSRAEYKAAIDKAANKRTTGLAGLPTELVRFIYESSTSVKDAVNLSKTCHGFHDIFWKDRLQLVQTIQRRTVHCYDLARQFVLEQQIHPSPMRIARCINEANNGTDLVVRQASPYFKHLVPCERTPQYTSVDEWIEAEVECSKQLKRPLQGDQLERLVECWYWMKLQASKHPPDDENLTQHDYDELEEEFEDDILSFSKVKIFVLVELQRFLTTSISQNDMKALGIFHQLPQSTDISCQMKYRDMKEDWDFVFGSLDMHCTTKRIWDKTLCMKLSGPCEKESWLREIGGKKPGKGLWEL